MRLVRLGVLTASVLLALLSLRCQAQAFPDDGTRAAARDLGQQGIESYLAEKYAAASEKLEKAYRLFATPTLGLWSARALRQRGLWVEAAERFRDTLRVPASMGDTATQKSALQDAGVELETLLSRLPAITITLGGSDAGGVLLSLDDAAIPSDLLGVRRPMNPGKHRVAATRGTLRAEAQIELAAGEHKPVELRFSEPGAKKLPAPMITRETGSDKSAVAGPTRVSALVASPLTAAGEVASEKALFPLKPLALAALALAGAGLVTSGITAIIAQGKCPGGRCSSPSAQAAYDPLRTVSNISFWSGAAFALGGAGAWLLAPAETAPRPGNVTWVLSPLGFSVSGVL